MDSMSFEIDDIITALAYDFMTTGRFVNDALNYIENKLGSGEEIDPYEFFRSEDFPYISKLFDSYNPNALGAKEYYLDLIDKLWEYQDSPADNQDFKDEVYASVLKNPSIAAFVTCNRETEGKIEKKIIGQLISFSEGKLDVNYTTFSRDINDFVSEISSNYYRNFDSNHFNLQEKLKQMRCYGLLEYEDLFSKEGITVTDFGRSVCGILNSFHLNGKIEWASKDLFMSIIMEETTTGNTFVTTGVDETSEEIDPSVDDDIEPSVDDDIEPLPDTPEAGVDDSVVEPLLIEGSEYLKLLSPLAVVSNFLAVRYLSEGGDVGFGLNLPDVLGSVPFSIPNENADDWLTIYERRKFPYGIQVNGKVEFALDEGRENVIKLLNCDGRISEEFMHIMSDCLNPGFDGASAGNSNWNIDALNRGLNLLIAMKYTYTEPEREIFDAISLDKRLRAEIKYM